MTINDGRKCGLVDYDCKDRLRICFSKFKAELNTSIEPSYKAKTITVPTNDNKIVTVDLIDEKRIIINKSGAT